MTVLGTTTILNSYTTENSNIVINNQSGAGPALAIYQSGSSSAGIIADFFDNDVSTTIPVLRVADGGNIGIGITNPSYN